MGGILVPSLRRRGSRYCVLDSECVRSRSLSKVSARSAAVTGPTREISGAFISALRRASETSIRHTGRPDRAADATTPPRRAAVTFQLERGVQPARAFVIETFPRFVQDNQLGGSGSGLSEVEQLFSPCDNDRIGRRSFNTTSPLPSAPHAAARTAGVETLPPPRSRPVSLERPRPNPAI